MLNDRRRTILSALVSEYIASAHPVASRAIVERYGLGVSPATVRNDLQVLEETGFVFQPHVSAGRVPTDEGYRAYVDGIAAPSIDAAAATPEADVIRGFYSRLDADRTEVLRDTAALLARMTSYMSVIVAPAVRRARVKRVSLVSLGATQVLLVLITDQGNVAKRFVELSVPVAEAALAEIERFLGSVLEEVVAEDAEAVHRVLMKAVPAYREVVAVLIGEMMACMVEVSEERLSHGGAAGLLAQPEFADPRSASPLLQLVEEGLALVHALADLGGEGGTVVRIGHENALAGLSNASVVATAFGPVGGGGVVCLIGPTRMEYGRAIGISRCVADALSETL